MVARVSEWRRFERGSRDRTGDQFWEIRVVGRDCEIRFGWIYAYQVNEERLEHASEAAAARTAKTKIYTRLRSGWIEIVPADESRMLAHEQGRELEQAIAADPSGLDNWAVYADWLQHIEPLIGERVMLGLALARAAVDAERTQLEARIAQIEKKHAHELFGAALTPALRGPKSRDVVELERQFGMIIGAALVEPRYEVVKLETLLDVLLAGPVARLLLHLSIDVRAEAPTFPLAVRTFVARHHPHLRRLKLGADHGYATTTERLPKIQALLERTPKLERLELYGQFLGDAVHPCLRELKLGRAHQSPKWTISRWQLPALEVLHVYDPGLVNWSQVKLPRLRQLLIECEGDVEVELLARAPVLRQLESLVLVESELTEVGAARILAHAERYAVLPRFVVLDHELDDENVAALQRSLPNLLLRPRPIVWRSRSPDEPPPAELLERDELTRF
jgi:hypothetical protein